MATTTRREIPEVQASPRQAIGTRHARRIRETGQVPAVIYGHGQETVHVSVDRKLTMQLLRTHNHLLRMKVAGREEPCLVNDTQWNHLGNELLHMDLTRVNLDEEVTVEVELEFVGEENAPGLKAEGAMLHQERTTLEVICKASDIPSAVRVNIASLDIGESITVADLDLPEGVQPTLEQEDPIASITMIEEEPEEAPEAPAEAPEVIGGEDEEGEAGEEADETA